MADITTAALRALVCAPAGLQQRVAGPPPTVDGQTLDPAVHFMLYLAEKGAASDKGGSVAQRRAAMRENSALVMRTPEGVATQDTVLADRIPVRVYRRDRLGTPAPVIVYFHGGGWVVGDLDTHDGSCRMLALHSGCVVVSVDYRLAPEHPFPAGLDDAVTAYEYVLARPEEFDGIPGHVAVMGDSAGGNLAAALCLRTAGGHRPTAQLLIYPATDLRMLTNSIDTFGRGFFLTKEDMLWYREQYLTDHAQVTDPLVSPLLAEDLAAMPPTAIWTAGFDPLRDEGRAYARALREAGVDVYERCLHDQIHGFFGIGVLPGAMARIAGISAQVGRFVRR